MGYSMEEYDYEETYKLIKTWSEGTVYKLDGSSIKIFHPEMNIKEVENKNKKINILKKSRKNNKRNVTY